MFYKQLLLAQIPKVQKIQSSWQYFLVLLGPTRVKSAHKTLAKLTPGVNFINVHKQLLREQIPKAQKRLKS